MYFEKIPNQTITINNKTLKAIKIKRTKHDSNIEAYFLPDQQYLPILIKQTKGVRDYVYEITNLNQTEVEKIQVTL